MIHSKPRNFIFLRVPKTASTSIHCQILDDVPSSEITTQTSISLDHVVIPSIGIDSEKNSKYTFNSLKSINIHPNLKELIELNVFDESEVSNLNVYGVIRNPVDRIISCAHHFVKSLKWENDVSDDVAVSALFNSDGFVKKPNNKFVLNKPQTYWLIHNNKPINKIFRYDQINLLLKDLCGRESIEYNYRSEYRVKKTANLSNELIQECRIRFAEDFTLWESLQPPQP